MVAVGLGAVGWKRSIATTVDGPFRLAPPHARSVALRIRPDPISTAEKKLVGSGQKSGTIEI
jgi:hypothetical protein